MKRTRGSRTEMLLKIYLGLLALSLALCGVLVHREIAGFLRGDDSTEVIAVAAHSTGPPLRYAPTINWGGARR